MNVRNEFTVLIFQNDSVVDTLCVWYSLFIFCTMVLLYFLTCGIQVKGGVAGLYDGAEVVLGPDSGVLEPNPEQQFINQKMRPGSGVLSVQVLPDGPTRVLQVRTKPRTRKNYN